MKKTDIYYEKIDYGNLKKDNDLNVIYNNRYYRDTSTKYYTGRIFDSPEIHFVFLDYVYHYINTQLNININNLLISNGQPVLHNNEKILLLFKGGNIMKYYYDKLISPLIDKGKNIKGYTILTKDGKEVPLDYENYYKTIRSYFSTSDNDFSLYLLTYDKYRFFILHKLIMDDIYNKLAVVRDVIENIYNNRFNKKILLQPAELKSFPDSVMDKISVIMKNIDNIVETIDTITKYQTLNMDNVQKMKCDNLLHKNIYDLIKKYNSIDDKKIYDNISSIIVETSKIDESVINDMIQLSLFMQCLQSIIFVTETLKKIRSGSYSSLNIVNIETKRINLLGQIDDILKHKQAVLESSDFYTQAKVDNIIDDIDKHFKKDNNKCYLYSKNNRMDIYKYHKSDELSIGLEKREDFMVSYTGNIFDYIKPVNINKIGHYHYISFNKIIYAKHLNEISFDLIRVKFNTVFKKDNIIINNTNDVDYPIPSEIIDISIANYSDYSYQKIKNEHTYERIDFYNRNISVMTYTLKGLYDDLGTILFQDIYFPWSDDKYEKRLVRYFIYGILQSYQINNSLDKIDDNFGMLSELSKKLYLNILNKNQYPYDYISEQKILISPYDRVPYNTSDVKRVIDNFDIINSSNFSTYLTINKKFSDIELILRVIILSSRMYKYDDSTLIEMYNNIQEKTHIPIEKNAANALDIRSKIANLLINVSNNSRSIIATLIYTGVIGKQPKLFQPINGNYQYRYHKYLSKYQKLIGNTAR
jgi:hypothetical protein